MHGYRRFNDDQMTGGGGSPAGMASPSESLRIGSLQKHRSRKEGSGR